MCVRCVYSVCVLSLPPPYPTPSANGRLAIDSALPSLKALVEARGLFLGRYRLGDLIHQSATCKVQVAEDTLDQGGLVVLKLMREHDQFERELLARDQSELPNGDVVEVLRHHELTDAKAGGDHFARGYVFCLVFPRGELNLQDALTHEHLAPSPAEVHWESVREIVRSIATCLRNLHQRGVMHGDIKPLNLMRFRQGNDKQVWKLIDLDAAAVIPTPTLDEAKGSSLPMHAGAKYSSGYLPPEMIHARSDGAFVVKTGVAPMDREGNTQPLDYTCVPANGAIDAWALAVTLFHMCTGQRLFNTNQEDNLTAADLRKLFQWSAATTKAKVSQIQHRLARNLVARLLVLEPADRLTMEEVLSHPFVTGEAPPGTPDDRTN